MSAAVPLTSRVLVAGTAGGVGATTVTALLFGAWAGRACAPRLGDHTAGSLGRRLAGGDEVGRLDDQTLLVDAGPVAFQLAEELADPLARLVVVSASTGAGCALTRECLARLRDTAGGDALSRTAVTLVETSGRTRGAAGLRALASAHPELVGLVVLPADPALAAGGRIPTERLAPRTREAVEQLVHLSGGQRTVTGVRVSG